MCGKQRMERIKLRSRSSRLALMVNDMWLGLAQAPELLKYLRGLQNERPVHFKSARAKRERERVWPLFYLLSELR